MIPVSHPDLAKYKCISNGTSGHSKMNFQPRLSRERKTNRSERINDDLRATLGLQHLTTRVTQKAEADLLKSPSKSGLTSSPMNYVKPL